MFEWKRKELEVEQVKFFGGTVKKFISCYAKQVKPRIKIKLKPEPSMADRLGLFGRGALGDVGSSMAQQQLLYYGDQMASLSAASAHGQAQAANPLGYSTACGIGGKGGAMVVAGMLR